MLQSPVNVVNKAAAASGASYGSTLASGSAIAITAGNYVYLLTGTTAVNTMTGGTSGSIVCLVASGQATGACVVLNHAASTNNLSLRDSANLGIYAGESVTFMFDGTKWVETARDLRKVLDYTQITSSASPTATSEATATAVVTSSSVTYDGATPVLIQFYCERILPGTSWITPVLYDASASIGLWTTQGQITTSRGLNLQRRLTPSAVARTYSARFYVDAGTGTINAGLGGITATMPAYLKISRDF